MRLIDADALADALFEKRKNYPQWVANTIGAMPDAIVRCNDCWKRPFDNCPFNEYADYQPEDDFFCADGERR